MGDIRWRCFDEASTLLGNEMQTQPPVAASNVEKVSRIEYEQGRPRFILQNGQIWQSEAPRRLTLQGEGKNCIRIDKTPVGFLLHFNGSLFGLPVVRVQ